VKKNIIVRLSPWAINLLQCFNTKKQYSFLEIKERYDSVYPLECRKILCRALGRTRPLEFGEALLNLLQSGCVFRIKGCYKISHVGFSYL
jgi:hypothetical protein